ncbi:16460_t:CDS:2 [Rhizophagus irregularis]|nr:16460_t:CDS:2 [Rhizophagus irregularis]
MYENLLWNYIKPQQTNKSPRNKKLQPAVGGFGFGQTTQPAAGGFGFSSTPPSGFGFGNRRRDQKTRSGEQTILLCNSLLLRSLGQ